MAVPFFVGGLVMLRVATLASGSSGNCTVISDGKVHILVDAGISARRIVRGLRDLGVEGKQIAGVLITMWHRSPAVVQGEELLRASGLPVFATHIRRSDKVDESTFAGEALGSYSRYSSAARDYSAFVAEYLEGCENG